MNVALITGATGFIGYWATLAARSHGFVVHAVSRAGDAPSTPLDGVTWHAGDLLDPGTRAHLIDKIQPSHLLHLAWVTEHGRYWEAPENETWVDASIDLATRFAGRGGRRLVTAGTCAEYDWRDEVLSISDCDETTSACGPTTLYGKCKLRLSSELTRLGGVSYAWGRLFLLFGPSENPRRLVPSVIRAILSSDLARVGPGELVRDFLHTRDAGAALVALLDSEVEGPVNVSSGDPTPIGELATRIGDLMGHRERIRVGALPPRSGDPPRLVGSVARLRNEVGFTPVFSLTEGLRTTVEWWTERERATKSWAAGVERSRW